MLDVNDIIEKLKDVLATERDKKIFDKDVANVLSCVFIQDSITWWLESKVCLFSEKISLSVFASYIQINYDYISLRKYTDKSIIIAVANKHYENLS